MEHLNLFTELESQPDHSPVVIDVAAQMKALRDRKPPRDQQDEPNESQHDPLEAAISAPLFVHAGIVSQHRTLGKGV